MTITDDPALRDAVLRAEEIALEDVSIRVIRRADLLREKLRAAADPARRRSKRLQDLADAQALIEVNRMGRGLYRLSGILYFAERGTTAFGD